MIQVNLSFKTNLTNALEMMPNPHGSRHTRRILTANEYAPSCCMQWRQQTAIGWTQHITSLKVFCALIWSHIIFSPRNYTARVAREGTIYWRHQKKTEGYRGEKHTHRRWQRWKQVSQKGHGVQMFITDIREWARKQSGELNYYRIQFLPRCCGCYRIRVHICQIDLKMPIQTEKCTVLLPVLKH